MSEITFKDKLSQSKRERSASEEYGYEKTDGEELVSERKKQRVDEEEKTDRLGEPVDAGKPEPSIISLTVEDAMLTLRKKRTTRFDRVILRPSAKGLKLLLREERQRNYPGQYGPKMRKPVIQRTRKRDMGKIARLLDAPIDILDEVASHLNPLDILYLARTSRGLRDVLMSKQARSVWESSCRAIGLPEFPAEFSCPEYVSLIFEKECKICGGIYVHTVDYEMRWRLCGPCQDANVIRGTTIAKKVFGIEVMKYDEIYNLIPLHASDKFFKPDFVDAVEVYLSFDSNIVERDKYVKELQALKQQLSECSSNIGSWHRKQNKKRQEEQDRAYRGRKEAIESKLKELGYTADEMKQTSRSYSSEWDSCVLQPRDLTPKIWKRIRPIIENLIKNNREKVRQDFLSQGRNARKLEIKQFFTEFCDMFGEEEGLLPSLQRIFGIGEIEYLMERDDCRTSISREDWNTVLSSVQKFCAEHIETVKADCLSRLLKVESMYEVKEEDAFMQDLSSIKRADAFFYCKNCRDDICALKTVRRSIETVTYPSITEHPHLRMALSESLHLVPWGSESVQCDSAVLLTARKLLSCLNLVTATMKDMNDYGRIFVCLCCHTPIKRTWHKLVQHFMKEQSQYQDIIKNRSAVKDIVLLDDHGKDAKDDLVKIEDANEEKSNYPCEVDDLKRSEERSWFCQFCRIIRAYACTTWMTREEAIIHARNRHNSDKGFEEVVVIPSDNINGIRLRFPPLP